MIKVPKINYELIGEEDDAQYKVLFEFQDRWKREGRWINGHLCDELKEFQSKGSEQIDYTLGSCIPNISPDCIVRGCDDHNPIPIKYCPFCGVKLE